jgi:hypothetical protein
MAVNFAPLPEITAAQRIGADWSGPSLITWITRSTRLKSVDGVIR